jgi:ubiquinone/menaquinone biosynthesis C-methylase UbiE
VTGAVRAAFRSFRNWAPLRRQRGRGSLVDATVWKTKPIEHGAVFAAPVAAPAIGAVDHDLAPIFGEFAWHSLTVDARLLQVSEDHYRLVAGLLNDAGAQSVSKARVLEIAAYAHITGYMLRERLGARTDLLDISPSTLRLGHRLAREQGFATDGTTCVAGDFHELPYEDDQFDVVYICSALHHTWRWQRVVSEMLRVLAPGGILFLENEPCRRLFCHYRFRANRPERFGDLEQALDRLGILRTITEPFPNTRPETLFGMVENQTISITALCAALAAKCSPVAITVNPEICMGPLEHELVARIGEGADACTRWLTAELANRVEQASHAMTEADKGMGFSLPTPDEIATLCESTAKALIELPADRSSPDFRLGIAEVFGASVQMTLRKKGARRVLPAARLRQDYPMLEEVVCAFPPHVARLLDPGSVLLPDIQSSPLSVLEHVFPAGDWHFRVSPDGLRDLSPATAHPSFTIPVPRPGPLLVLVRLYVAVEGLPFRIALCDDSGELAGFDAYRADSLLLSPVVQCAPDASLLRLSIRTVGLGAAAGQDLAGIFTLSYAGAFPL